MHGPGIGNLLAARTALQLCHLRIRIMVCCTVRVYMMLSHPVICAVMEHVGFTDSPGQLA